MRDVEADGDKEERSCFNGDNIIMWKCFIRICVSCLQVEYLERRRKEIVDQNVVPEVNVFSIRLGCDKGCCEEVGWQQR